MVEDARLMIVGCTAAEFPTGKKSVRQLPQLLGLVVRLAASRFLTLEELLTAMLDI